ncbi:unnamed protein product [Clonostachys chloroleuca]|uniref:Uncharacterized protein n=1 Tax=Clonostachys chloroleuca TaxID=1926264 RepID=A0AA35LNT9_9HYPO|nr:unnamed protein product [Clonostachys chloroleuca]
MACSGTRGNLDQQLVPCKLGKSPPALVYRRYGIRWHTQGNILWASAARCWAGRGHEQWRGH